MSSTKDILLSEIEEFLRRHDMPPTKFGELSVNDGKLLPGLRQEGRDITTGRMDRIRAFMRAYKGQAVAQKRTRPNQRASARDVAA